MDYLQSRDVEYSAWLFLLAGLFLILIEQKLYKQSKWNKERNAARWAGWIDIGVSAAILGYGLVYKIWHW